VSGFVEDFSARGDRDGQGRSLRDFDLQTRLFKYPCSFLIYSDAFEALPEPMLDAVYARLLEVLTARPSSDGDGDSFTHLSISDRKAILEILADTKPGFRERLDAVSQPVN
jgi:hypothetical protein